MIAIRARRSIRSALAIVMSVSSLGVIAMTSPADASVSYHTERYESRELPVGRWQYDVNGNPTQKDPACPNYPGVYRSSKVWVDVFAVGEPTHASMRMQFHTTYKPSIAIAKLAYSNAGLGLMAMNCSVLNSHRYTGVVETLKNTACAAAKNRPNRWCDVAFNNPNDPALDLFLKRPCAVLPGGPYPVASHEWHNVKGPLYDIDVLSELSEKMAEYANQLGMSFKIPVYIDALTVVAGVSNFDQSTAQPAWGDTWEGYGHVQTAPVSEAFMLWYDQAARNLGKSPLNKPVVAHNAVDEAIAKGKDVRGTGGMTYAQMLNLACTYTPKISDALGDGNGVISKIALGEDMSGWVKAETGQTLCQRIKTIPEFKEIAPAVCNFVFAGFTFELIDNHRCMNQTNPDGTHDAMAEALGTNLGCDRQTHLAKTFVQMKKFLGG